MEAVAGRIYAQIINGKFQWKFTQAELPEWADDAFEVVDITDMNPMPTEGDTWNGVEFVTPVQPAQVSHIPSSVSMRQARLALLQAGYLDQVTTGIANMDRATQIEWEFATSVLRDSPLVIQLATALNLNSAALDSLFTLASTL
jgi:hypothetical protein